jgi:hypothetical protein
MARTLESFAKVPDIVLAKLVLNNRGHEFDIGQQRSIQTNPLTGSWRRTGLTIQAFVTL